MTERTATAAMSRTEWLELRKTGIGGSDAGAVCGLNPYASPISVYLDKTSDTAEYRDNEAMRQGRDLEDYVARRFMEETGLKVHRSNAMYRSRRYPFMIADVDRFVTGQDAGLECKTASPYNADKWKEGSIPPHYVLQCYHYMAVTGKRTWYIAVVILGQEFRYAKLTWDDRIIEDLIRMEEAFWNHHVIPGIMPQPDGSEACDKALARYFNGGKEGIVPLVGFDEKLDRRQEIGEQIRRLEQEQRQIDQEIKLFLGESERASSSQYQVSWQTVLTNRLDTKRIKEEKPEIYRDYLVENRTRKFTVKAA